MRMGNVSLYLSKCTSMCILKIVYQTLKRKKRYRTILRRKLLLRVIHVKNKVNFTCSYA